MPEVNILSVGGESDFGPVLHVLTVAVLVNRAVGSFVVGVLRLRYKGTGNLGDPDGGGDARSDHGLLTESDLLLLTNMCARQGREGKGLLGEFRESLLV